MSGRTIKIVQVHDKGVGLYRWADYSGIIGGPIRAFELQNLDVMVLRIHFKDLERGTAGDTSVSVLKRLAKRFGAKVVVYDVNGKKLRV